MGTCCVGWVQNTLLDVLVTFKAHWPLCDSLNQSGKRKPGGAPPQVPLPGPDELGSQPHPWQWVDSHKSLYGAVQCSEIKEPETPNYGP